MNWERILMESITVALISVAAALLLNVWTDFKGWKKIEKLIGNLNGTTLGRQHEDIEKTVVNEARTIKTGSDKIENMVGNIAAILNKQEGRYESLNLDQKEIRNHVLKLVNNWEELIKENQELKQAVRELKKENDKLKERIKELEYEEGRER
ncbi:MAG: hypothetical protein PWQ60_2399 [Thermoanaerobacteraceae bacterium]|nr:hypothetical protein [Thermoanaerobacteraceae bacterium]